MMRYRYVIAAAFACVLLPALIGCGQQQPTPPRPVTGTPWRRPTLGGGPNANGTQGKKPAPTSGTG